MTILVFEDNLIWSSRLVKSLRSLGHVPVVRTKAEQSAGDAMVAIINLGNDDFVSSGLVSFLNDAGVFTIGHAGHKETEVLQSGKEAGCRLLVTNSQLTFKIESILSQVTGQ